MHVDQGGFVASEGHLARDLGVIRNPTSVEPEWHALGKLDPRHGGGREVRRIQDHELALVRSFVIDEIENPSFVAVRSRPGAAAKTGSAGVMPGP